MQDIEKNIAVIILAAGMGTRMKSRMAKVLHKILGKPMIIYVVETAKKVVKNNIIVVVGNQADDVRKVVSEKGELIYAEQKKQLGTGHAVLCALPYLPDYIEDVVILYGDVPLLSADTIIRLIENHVKSKHDITILSVNLDNPAGYGRVLFDEKLNISSIVEEADATEEQKKIKGINTGIYCIKKDFLLKFLCEIKSNNAQEELYLTDIVEIGYREKKNIGVLVSREYEEVTGVNTLADLLKVEKIMREKSP